ncbi:MAG TPA: SsrA-binding protein, partial [Geminicoccaceae bacterium]|nr:SsrA-binding protein [Geminicoccaceae bacterium]
MTAAAPAAARRSVAQNRKALHNYFIDERFEAGIVLSGTEVKSLRRGRASITEAYAGESGGELYLFNA